MILSPTPGQRVAFDYDGRRTLGRFVRVGTRAEAMELPWYDGTRKADVAWVKLADGSEIATVYARLELP